MLLEANSAGDFHLPESIGKPRQVLGGMLFEGT